MTFIRGLPVVGPMLEPCEKVAVIRFAGVIADASISKKGISYHRYAKAIDKAFDKGGVKAVALVINSPGGSAAQTSLIAGHIRQRAEEKEIPVFAFVEDVAASGGYWLACAADEIYAQESSIVGSIGVISASFGFEDLIEKYGIHRRLYTSGDQKSFLDPFSPEKKEDIARLKAIQKEIHQAFIDWVTERRGDVLKASDKDVFDGSFWTAGPAQERGLINGLGDVRSVMRARFGDEVKFAEATPDKGLPVPVPFIGKLQAGMADGFSDELVDTLETRAVWARYGL